MIFLSSEQQEAILLDLLRVIRHHRARLATPIRTVQKVFTDADLDSVPFSDTMYSNRGGVSNRPVLLIEPSYKVNGEDKPKSQARSSRANGEEDVKGTTTKPVPDTKAEPKAETNLSTDPKPRPAASDDEPKELQKSDSEAGKMPKVETKEDPKIASKPSSDSKLSSSAKSATKPSLEENIVLGVALDGSKRTLPIEEETVVPPNPEDTKELATLRSGNGPTTTEEKNESKRPNAPNSLSNDQSEQQS